MRSPCKRYLTFAGDGKHTNHGWDAYQGSFDSYANAEHHIKERMNGFDSETVWGQIFDSNTGGITYFPEKE